MGVHLLMGQSRLARPDRLEDGQVELPRFIGVMVPVDVQAGNVQVVPLYVGSIGDPGTTAATYQGMMRVNAERIASALKG